MLPGLVVLAVWTFSAVVAWRLRHGALVRLHAVAAVGLALAVVSISRIFGPLWYYLMMWAWGTTSVLLLATVWSLGVHLARRRAPTTALLGFGPAAMVATIVVSSVAFSVQAADVEQPAPELSDTMQVLVPPVIDELSDGDRPGLGRDERYLVHWSDAVHIGSQGIALVN